MIKEILERVFSFLYTPGGLFLSWLVIILIIKPRRSNHGKRSNGNNGSTIQRSIDGNAGRVRSGRKER